MASAAAPAAARVPWQDVTGTANGIDLSSNLISTPRFEFSNPARHQYPIVVFATRQPLVTCLKLKEWLLDKFTKPEFACEGFLRVETQELEYLRYDDNALLVLLDDAAHFHRKPSLKLSVLALFVKNEQRIRWYYCASSFIPLLLDLCAEGIINSRNEVHPRTAMYDRLFTYLREHFLASVNIPEHPDFRAAQQITDFCVPVLDPETALQRIYRCDALYAVQQHPYHEYEQLDLEFDRYIDDIHPAEREICTLIRLKCAEYLLLKRRFFRAFYRELNLRYERIGKDNRRVRTEAANEGWFENEYGWRSGSERAKRPSRSQRLLKAWTLLGFLDEKRYLPSLGKAGGFLEYEQIGQEGGSANPERVMRESEADESKASRKRNESDNEETEVKYEPMQTRSRTRGQAARG